ncbi:MAG: FRG domain-containing protein [Armatimonadetes bacterium]|nr:FRG domain-containing protein [Armatimonadota bacterium]
MADGYHVFSFDDWASFSFYIQKRMTQYHRYIYRGQREAEWPLETSFERECNKYGISEAVREKRLKEHLEGFRQAIRGREEGHVDKSDDDEVWVLGQHYGLATPLLDWTKSPFVAAYFAFHSPEPSETELRAVWGFYPNRLVKAGLVKVIDPESSFNSRLLSQRGVLTKVEKPGSIEEHIMGVYNGKLSRKNGIMKFLIPDREREIALKALNQMNINHMSLFPDLEGASQYSNLRLQFDKY